MKKIYIVSALLVAGSGAMAQSLIKQELTASQMREVEPVGPNTSGIEVADTLNLAEFGTEAWLYVAQSGYVFGSNALPGEIQGIPVVQMNYEFASGYIVNNPYNVTGALLWFGAKEAVSSSPSDLKVKLWSLGENKALGTAASTAPDAIGPDQVLKTVNLPFADVNVDVNTIVFFPTAQWVNSDFAISVDIKDLYNGTDAADTAAVYASAQGVADGDYTWTNFGVDIAPQTLWAKTNATLQTPLNAYVGIFAIVEESLIGIEEQGFINGVKLTTYPNPALTSDNVRIDYALESSAKAVEINVFDMNGRLVCTMEEGSRAAGVHTVNVAAGTLSAGSYIYAITADSNRIAKRMEVVK
ncbi:MAG: T9SS type A sorting domain-containing protein [Flavobacteriales bacterium]|nr:T9SS type A sorting domain-containing protein [Flavobacteriales bacterium]